MDNNPYQAPDADLDSVETDVIQRSIWWKIYFVFLVLLTVLGVSIVFVEEDNIGIVEYIDLAASIVATLGLFGYAFSKKIFTREFWFAWLIVYILWTIAYFFLSDLDWSEGLSDTEVWVSNAIGFTLVSPGYIALILYSLPSNRLWTLSSNKIT